jgi:homoserine dehydrogenase
MIRIALLGFGNVGRALVQLPEMTRALECGEITLIGVADLSGALRLKSPGELRLLQKHLKRESLLRDATPGASLCEIQDFLDSLSSADCDVLVECMPTNLTDGEPALSHLRSFLEKGISVVTVDKGPIVHGFQQLRRAADRGNARFAYGGTTGVRAPVEIVNEEIREIQGILNGTTNYVLSEMLEHSISFAQALETAQQKGIAETNPSLDIGGWDSSCKILILANEWMEAGAALAEVSRHGIGPETDDLIKQARSSGGAVRLMARASRQADRVMIRVSPEIVRPDSLFYSISGTAKGAQFLTASGGTFFSAGRSGLDSISQIILDDIRTVARGD